MQTRENTFHLQALIWTAAVCIVSIGFIGPDVFGQDRQKNMFVGLTLALIAYMALEMSLLVRNEGMAAVIAPPFMASIATFGLGYCGWNIFFAMDMSEVPEYYILRGTTYESLVQTMQFLLIGAIGMWRGYHFRIGRALGSALRRTLDGHRLIRAGYELRVEIIALLVVVHIGSTLAQVALGIFGYSADIAELHATASLSQWLNYGSAGGTLALVAVSLAYFSGARGNRQLLLVLLVGLLVWRMLLGLLLGFKGQFLLPLVTVGIVYFALRRRIPAVLMAITVVAVVVAYGVVEPFRVARNTNSGFDNRDLGSIAQTLTENAFTGTGGVDPWLPLQRTSMTWYTAIAIDYKDRNGLEQDDPTFLDRLVLSPIYAFVPRIFWPSKPTASIGYWFNTQVLGAASHNTTSIGMGPVGYLYFAGGGLAVVVGFLVIGISQRVVVTVLMERAGSGHWLLYIGILYPFVLIDSDLGSSLTGLFRAIPLLLVIQYALFKAGDSRGARVPATSVS